MSKPFFLTDQTHLYLQYTIQEKNGLFFIFLNLFFFSASLISIMGALISRHDPF
jgi:hypothetical protein